MLYSSEIERVNIFHGTFIFYKILGTVLFPLLKIFYKIKHKNIMYNET
jgi:hypothetical protein